MSNDAGGRHGKRVRRRRTSRRSRWAVGGLALGLLLLLGVGLANLRYLPALDEARSLRAEITAIASRAQAAGLAIDGPRVDALDRDLATARGHLARLTDFVAHDPLIALARAFPPTTNEVDHLLQRAPRGIPDEIRNSGSGAGLPAQ